MKKIAYACCIGVIAIITSEFGVIGILPQVAAHYNISISTAGLLLSVFSMVVAIGGPLFSLVLSGLNRKKIMLCSLALYLVNGILSSLAPPFWLLLAARALPALLHAVYYSAAIVVVVNSAGARYQHRMMAIALSGISIATVVTIPFASYLASSFSFQYSFVMQSIVTAFGIVSIFYLVPSTPSTGRTGYGNQLSILKRPVIWLNLLVTFLMFAAEFSLYGYFADYLIKAKSMSLESVSYLLLVFGTAGLAGNWIAGKTLSKSIPGTTIAFLLGCNVLVPLALYVTGNNIAMLYLLVAAWGIVYAPGFLIATSAISAAAPEALEFANSLVNSFANLGITAGTLLAGYLIVSGGMNEVPWIPVTLGVMAVIVVVIKGIAERVPAKATNATG